MVYTGKHARHRSVPRQAGAAEPPPDVTLDHLGDELDFLEDEEAQDHDGSHERMQHLLGSIHLQGISPRSIRWQSPIYIADSKRPETADEYETASAERGIGPSAPYETPYDRDDTVILVAVERPPSAPSDGPSERDG